MARLVVYVRSSFCPDVARWRRWVSEHPLEYVEIDIDRDVEGYDRVIAWTGHEAVPTLVIAADDEIDRARSRARSRPAAGPGRWTVARC